MPTTTPPNTPLQQRTLCRSTRKPMPAIDNLLDRIKREMELRELTLCPNSTGPVNTLNVSAQIRVRVLNCVSIDCETDTVPMTIVSIWSPHYTEHNVYMGGMTHTLKETDPHTDC